MTTAKTVQRNELLRHLPSVDEILRTDTGRAYAETEGANSAAVAARQVLSALRDRMSAGAVDVNDRPGLVDTAEAELGRLLAVGSRSGIHGVINATGVIIHTNLGRAPLSNDAKTALLEAAGNCTLEFDLETGKRGTRGGRVERLIAEITGAEAAVVVNNGAAAAFLVLTALTAGGEVVISRGELVEIGGDFRVPDVLAASGAVLREVGTTNRTKTADYARAIGPDTRMILRVHPSNFRIVGFTAAPSREDLSSLAKEQNLVFYEDLGSGALVDLKTAGLADEPSVAHAIEAGVDLVSFSGDKLLGGPQAGIIAGRKDLVELIGKHPLFRVLRPDKLAYAALEATLQSYRKGEMFDTIPVLRQLSATADVIGERTQRLLDFIGRLEHVTLQIVDGSSAVGGGAAPGMEIATRLLSVNHSQLSAQELEDRLRLDPSKPVIARIEDGRVLLDLRTVAVEDEDVLAAAIRRLDT